MNQSGSSAARRATCDCSSRAYRGRGILVMLAVFGCFAGSALGENDECTVVQIPGAIFSRAACALPLYENSDEAIYGWTLQCAAPAVGDLDGDGSEDLVLLVSDVEGAGTAEERWTGSILLCFNDGTGAFADFLVLAEFNIYPSDVAAADIDGDGNLDIIGLLIDESQLAVWFGDGTGEFEFAIPVHGESACVAFEMADATEDGIQDVVMIADYSSDVPWMRRIVVLPINEDGGVEPPIGTELGLECVLLGSKPWQIQVGEFTGDDHLDVVAVGQTYDGASAILVACGDGTGRFDAEAQICGVDYYASDTASADFDGDGTTDLAVAHVFDVEDMRANPNAYHESHYSSVYFGGFAFPKESARVDIGLFAFVLDAADLDADGVADLIGFNTEGTASVVLSEPDRAFSPASLYCISGVPWTGFVADLNGDEQVDIALQSVDAGLHVRLGDGTGVVGAGWLSAPLVSAVPHFESFGRFVEDFNGDGLTDLVCLRSSDAGVAYGDGEGGFPRYGSLHLSSEEAVDAVAVDMNLDGLPDLIIAGEAVKGGVPIRVLLSRGAEGFESVPIDVDFPTGTATNLAKWMVDDEGGVTLVALCGDGLYKLHLELADDEPLRITGAVTLIVQEGVEESIVKPEMYDMNGDGYLDLLYNSWYRQTGETVLLAGDAAGGLRETSRIPSVYSVVVDFNLDGLLDIGTSQGAFAGTGDLMFEEWNTDRGFYSAEDLDGDGAPDLLFAYGDSVMLSRSDGLGDWSQKVAFAATNGMSGIESMTPAYADFNEDGLLDVALCIGDGISVLLNNMGGQQ